MHERTTLKPVVTYTLDRDFALVGVGGQWTDFAIANGAPHLVPPPIGRPIFSFITDKTTVAVYARIFRRVQLERTPVSFDIRCDAPALRRFLSIRIAPLPDDCLWFTSTVMREEARPAVALLDAAAARTAELLHSCAWCQRIDVRGEWLEVELAVTALGLFLEPELPLLTHGICEQCTARMEPLAGS